MNTRRPDAIDIPMFVLNKPTKPRFKPVAVLIRNAIISFWSVPPKSRRPFLFQQYSKDPDVTPLMSHISVRNGAKNMRNEK